MLNAISEESRMLQTLQIISLVIGLPSTAIVLLTLICKPFRARLLERYRGRETDRCLLRDRITGIYYKHYQEREMRLYEYENLEKLYKQYKQLGGNSFIDKVWEEVQEWKINQ